MKIKLCGIAALMLSASPACAITTTYDYTGGLMTLYCDDSGQGQCARLGLTGRVEAFVTFDFDTSNTTGVFSISNYIPDPGISSAGVTFNYGYGTDGAEGSYARNADFALTDGQITGWYVQNSAPGPDGFSVSTSGGGDAMSAIGGNYYSLSGSAPPGSWTGPPEAFSTPATPLPAALPLLATGLGVMGLLGRRRKRKPVGIQQ
jgi:hypothetical protein